MARHAALSFTPALESELRSPGHRHRSESQTSAPKARMGATSVSCRGSGNGPSSGFPARETTPQQPQKPSEPKGRHGGDDPLWFPQQSIWRIYPLFFFGYSFFTLFFLFYSWLLLPQIIMAIRKFGHELLHKQRQWPGKITATHTTQRKTLFSSLAFGMGRCGCCPLPHICHQSAMSLGATCRLMSARRSIPLAHQGEKKKRYP